MEERDNGITVELIDYLRTLWWGKWIILGCLVVTVGLSVLFVGFQPTTTAYSGSTELLLREYVTAIVDCEQDATAAMGSAVGFALTAVEDTVPGITASIADNRITLSQSNGASADAVREALAQAKTLLEQRLPPSIAKELEHLARLAQIERSGLVAELEILRQRLSEERNSAEDPVLQSLAGRIAGLEEQLALLQVRLDILETTEPSNLVILSPISESTITSTVSKSNLKTTLALAGFLGLLIGVLLAFFVHYLLQVREREQRAVRDEQN